MKKKKDTFINMVVSLFAITIIAGFSLGFVNELTVGPIEKGKIANISIFDQSVTSSTSFLPNYSWVTIVDGEIVFDMR